MKYILMFLFACHAHAAVEVYSGCSLPTPVKTHWYFDAVNGDDIAGDGSQLKPWKTVQQVFNPANGKGPLYNQVPYWHPVAGKWQMAAEAGAPIKPGDALDLMTGSYGDLKYGVYPLSIYPSDWLTIEPVAGQKPVFTSIALIGISKLYFHDIKIQATVGSAMIYMTGQGAYPIDEKGFFQFPTTDVIFDHMTISSIDDASAWTAADWIAKARSAFSIYPFSSRCIALTNSSISNVASGLGVGGEKILIAHNTINYFRDDALDFYGSLLNIHHNRITNSFSVSDTHKDFMQGQIGHRFVGTFNHYHDIVIDSNTMIGKTEAKNTLYTYCQGIATFDEDWTNLVVTNNTIITSSCWGVGFQSVHSGEIGHNTVVADGLGTANCAPGITATGKSHESPTVTDHINVHHNISGNFGVDLDQGNLFESNICTGNSCNIAIVQGGKTVWSGQASGTNKNDKQFTQFLPSLYRFNMLAIPGSLAQAMGAGAK